MPLIKRNYIDGETVITAQNLNDIQDAILSLEDGLFVMDNSGSGETITITDASKRGFKSFSIYGKTTQDGTPTPDNLVDLVSVGNSGSITVNVTGNNNSQSMTITTPNGLPGVQVSSGGNYTDANGQRWICDEIDFSSGVYIQRINVVDFSNAMGAREARANGANYRFSFPLASNPTFLPGAPQRGTMCNAFKSSTEPLGQNSVNNVISAYSAGGLYLRCDKYETVEAFLSWAKSINLKAQYILATPIERTLSEEEMVEFTKLYTYKDNTTVTNDAGAHMSLEYYMDAKKYIDSLQTNSGVGRIVNISLPAVKWTGSGSLYSQVVSIPGITENSQVNLTPTVSQMSAFYDKDISFVTENDGGTVTVYVIGQKPTNDYTIPANIVEVRV